VNHRDPDTLIGSAAAGFGTGGLTLQWATDFGSLALIAINLVLAMAGGYLLLLRIIKAHRDIRDDRDDRGNG
jgi:hypothetical protein